MTASLAFRRHEAAILRGDPPEKYRRLLPHIPPGQVLELGSAEGVLACMLAREGRSVTALDRNSARHRAAQRLAGEWGVRGITFVNADILDRRDLLGGVDVLVAIRMIYYLRERLDDAFAEIARQVPIVVLCGNRNRADAWRKGAPHEPLGQWNEYASSEGMTRVLERHGYLATVIDPRGDEIVVGRR